MLEQKVIEGLGFPLPHLSAEERHQRRLAHRNERSIYKNTCAMTGKPTISIFSPDSPYKVYSQEVWHGDSWDAREYGRDFDFSRPFFDQFAELQKDVPQLALCNMQGENSDYCNITTNNKNCYLVFGGDFCEDCMHSVFSMHCRDVMDAYWVNRSELVYDSVDSEHCYNARYCEKSTQCRDSDFLFECRNCQDCFGCVGLVGKRFHIFNEEVSEEVYRKRVAEYRLDTWSGVQKMKAEFAEFKLKFPHRYASILNCENVTGDQLSNAKNVENCFGIFGPAEDLKDVFLAGWDSKDIVSCDHVGHKVELFYECLGSVTGSSCAFCLFAWHSHDIFYSQMVMNSQYLFGCSNMKRAEYCILNKQYSKEEYEALLTRVIEHMKKTGEWGEFFPMGKSMFAYNETVAQDYFPLTQAEAEKRGLKWRVEAIHPIQKNSVPDSIVEVGDEILNQILVCEQTGRSFKIIPQELAFYRKMKVPIPRFAPETRNSLRIQKRNPIQLWDRECGQCKKALRSSYAPERPEIICCDTCYLKTVY